MKQIAFLFQTLAIVLLAGCLFVPDAPSPGPGDSSSLDSKDRKPAERGGWDDFPNKYKPILVDLDANARQLPMPYGTRYTTLYSTQPANLAKTAACPGDSTVFIYQSPASDFFLYDTIAYYDSLGAAHCAAPGGSRAGERHLRRIVELGVGESRETLRDSITDQDILPRHTLHGTGSIRLESGSEFTIRSFDLSLLTQFGTQDAYVLDAGLELVYKDAYAIRLGLAKTHPYQAADFFPVGGEVRHELIMTGPITHASADGGLDTLGYIDLFDDHILQVRDWTGARLTP